MNIWKLYMLRALIILLILKNRLLDKDDSVQITEISCWSFPKGQGYKNKDAPSLELWLLTVMYLKSRFRESIA